MIRRAGQWLHDALLGGSGIEGRLQHDWPWPPWVALLAMILASLLVLLIYLREPVQGPRWRRAALPLLRIALLGLVLLMMHGWTLQRFRTDLADLVLIFDDSASMLHEDQPAAADSQARIDRVRRALLDNQPLRRRLEDSYHLKVYRLATTPRQAGELRTTLEQLHIDPQSREHAATRLGEGLRRVLESQRGQPTAAIVMFTDGVTTSGRTLSEVAEDARRHNTQLLLVGVGDQRPPRDLLLGDLLHQRTAFAGDLLHFDAKLFGPGLAGESVEVQLRLGGDVVARRQVEVAAEGGPAPVRLTYRAERPGDYQFQLHVAARPQESNAANNTLNAQVTVRDETIRVLMLQGAPSFDFQFLKMLLTRGLRRDQANKAFAVTTVLQEGDPEYTRQDATAARVFPVTRDDLFSYDVLVLGDADPRGLSESQMRNIVEFVSQRGGGLVILSGPRHMPLSYRQTPIAELLPIELATASAPPPDAPLDVAYQPQLTAIGATMPHLQLADTLEQSRQAWQSMPPLYWLLEAPDLTADARVLLEHPVRLGSTGSGLPVVCSRFFGAGKIVFHATDESFRWSPHPDGPQYYARYWLQTMRYLSRAKLGDAQGVELTKDREQYQQGQPVSLRVRFLDDRLAPAPDDGVVMVVEREGGRRQQVRLSRASALRGVFEGVVSELPAGQYRVWMASPTLSGEPPALSLTVAPPYGETTRLQMDADDMRQAAQLSGGKFLLLDQLDQLADDLPQGRRVRVEPLSPRSIWNSNILAALFVLLLLAEWTLRRRAALA